MKCYTDIEQSKKLAKILPTESADMYYPNRSDIKINCALPIEWKNGNPLNSQEIHAWSLSALFDAMPPIQELCSSTDHYYRVRCMNLFSEWHENAIDSCVEIIVKLHKKELL